MTKKEFLALLDIALSMGSQLNSLIDEQQEYLENLQADSARETEDLMKKLKGNK